MQHYGHGVTETKENYILPITAGAITPTNIYSIKKGAPKSPGELKGTITTEVKGSIKGNTSRGIYGDMVSNTSNNSIKISNKVSTGDAYIYCTLDDNKVEKYKIKIEKVLDNKSNKNMIINVTDERLIEKTGGIVQGMSGSPIVQNGKLIGAVTHVFLNDPLRGYGVFIQNMIDDLNSIK